MKNITKKGSCRLGGLVFYHPEIEHMRFHEWIEKGCPPDTYIYATPEILMLAHIPMVDVRIDCGTIFRSEVGELQQCDWRIMHYMMPSNRKIGTQRSVFDGILPIDPKKQSPNMKIRLK